MEIRPLGAKNGRKQDLSYMCAVFVLRRFGKSHFFMKIFKILTHMSELTFQKTHMYIQTLDNLRASRPQATQNGRSFCESSNSNG